jgi:hypothetical protein
LPQGAAVVGQVHPLCKGCEGGTPQLVNGMDSSTNAGILAGLEVLANSEAQVCGLATHVGPCTAMKQVANRIAKVWHGATEMALERWLGARSQQTGALMHPTTARFCI